MNEKLYEQAMTAIRNLFGDTSVSKETAIENLKSLVYEIETMIDALEMDE